MLSNICDKYSVLISKLINDYLAWLRPTVARIISFANSVMKKNGNILRYNIPSNGTLKQSKAFHNTYCTSILEAMRRYRIAQSADNFLYGIIDDKGNVIVDFLYDKIHNLGEFCWPGPGPLPPKEKFFIGAFFRQGEDAGYLFIQKDGSMVEYKRCSYNEFIHRCRLT